MLTNKLFKKENHPVKKWANELNRYFSKEDIPMGNKYLKIG